MRSPQSPRSAVHLDFVGVALLAFSAVGLPAVMVRGPSPSGSLCIALTQAAVFAGCLGAALIYGSTPKAHPRSGPQGASCGALFAVATACAVLFLRPATPRLMPELWPLGLLAIACALAGAALAAVLHGNSFRCGHIVGAYILGAGVAGVEVLGGLNSLGAGAVAPVVGGAAGVGALLLTYSRGDAISRSLAGAALALCLAVPALQRLELPLPGLPSPGSWWILPDSAVADLTRFVVWFSALVAIAAPSAFTAAVGKDQRSGLLRLYLILLLWVAAVSLLLWHPTHRPAATLSALVPGSLILWMAAGGLAGGVVADSWPISAAGLARALAGGVVGLLATLALGFVPGTWGAASPGMTAALAALVFAVGLLVGLAVPAAARAGVLQDPIHPVWLLSGAGLAAVAVSGYLGQVQHDPATAKFFTWAGVLLAILCLAVASETQTWRDWLLEVHQWLTREWGVRPPAEAPAVPMGRRGAYAPWFRVLKAMVYGGYAPWWVVFGLLRAVWGVVYALWSLAYGVVSGVVGGLLEMVFGKVPEISAQRVVIADRAPVVSLEEEQPPEEAGQEAVAKRKGITLGGILSLPMLALAAALERLTRVGQRMALRLRRTPGEEPQPETAVSETEGVTETIVLGPSEEVIAAEPSAAEIARARALQECLEDSRWRRCLRRVIGGLLSLRAREWLGPDNAESWDDRRFRAALVGPDGRHFELLGHLWASRRRRGCVVTVLSPSGQVDKGVEVAVASREVRNLLDQDPEQLKKILLRAAYRTAVMDIRAGALASRVIKCDAPREDLVEPHQDRYCELREELPGIGFRCRQPLPQDGSRGGTTLAACSGCNFPEIWERCRSLKLEGTVGTVDEVLHRQAHMLCSMTGSIADVGECLGRECFSPSLVTRIIAVDQRRTR